VPSGSLRKDKQANNNKRREDCGGERAAERKPAIIHWLVKKIPNRCAKWTGENERHPK
jgi:hypothetical protein